MPKRNTKGLTQVPHKVDFTAAKRDLIPDGEIGAQMSEFKFVEKSKTSGEPYVLLTFDVTEEPFAGRKLFRNFSLQPQSLWAIKQAAVKMGADPDDFNEDTDLEEVLQGILQNSPDCTLVVDRHVYQGEERNGVKEVKEPSSSFSRA